MSYAEKQGWVVSKNIKPQLFNSSVLLVSPVSTKAVHQELCRVKSHGWALISQRFAHWCQCQLLVSVVPSEESTSLSSLHLREFNVEKHQSSLPSKLFLPRVWRISNGLGCKIMAFPGPTNLGKWACYCQKYGTILEDHVHSVKVVPCTRWIMHQYTQQDWWQRGLMYMKVKLNICCGLHSHQVWILLSHFGFF